MEKLLSSIFGLHAGKAISIPQEKITDEVKATLREMLSTFPEESQSLISMRFGINSGKDYMLDDAAKELRITRERARQIEARTLRQLSHPTLYKKLRHLLNS